MSEILSVIRPCREVTVSPKMITRWGFYVAKYGYSQWAKDANLLKDLYAWVLIRIDNIVERLVYLNGAYAHMPDDNFPAETC